MEESQDFSFRHIAQLLLPDLFEKSSPFLFIRDLPTSVVNQDRLLAEVLEDLVNGLPGLSTCHTCSHLLHAPCCIHLIDLPSPLCEGLDDEEVHDIWPLVAAHVLL
eukprot:scaffold15929_cov159-Ochromonas_danica.AAC.10